MSPEIYWLTWSCVLTALLWIPYAMVRIAKIGLIRLVMDPLPGDNPFDKPWAHRAHMNAVESISVFAPVALAVHVTGTSNGITAVAAAVAAAVYFFARLIYIPIHIFQVPILRLGLFTVALVSTLIMAHQLIG